MILRLTKRFAFSASHERSGKHFGHNYVLAVTVEAAPETSEEDITARVDRSLIHKMESRDLSVHVDFLKGVDITDANLLSVFWGILEKELAPARVESLTLVKDSRSEHTLSRR